MNSLISFDLVPYCLTMEYSPAFSAETASNLVCLLVVGELQSVILRGQGIHLLLRRNSSVNYQARKD